MYNVINSLEICYVMNKEVKVTSPTIISHSDTDTPKTAAPLLISNLGSSNRAGTFSANIIKEYKTSYQLLGD